MDPRSILTSAGVLCICYVSPTSFFSTPPPQANSPEASSLPANTQADARPMPTPEATNYQYQLAKQQCDAVQSFEKARLKEGRPAYERITTAYRTR